jgi:hypothetical protein
MEPASVVSVLTKLQAGDPGFEPKRRHAILSVFKMSILALRPTKCSYLDKEVGCEVDRSSPPSAKVINEWSCVSTSPIYICGMDIFYRNSVFIVM